jgi:hypothetical protein
MELRHTLKFLKGEAMREERLKVLSMLQEGKITAEEAERLLAALSGGAEETGEAGPRRRPHRQFWDFEFDFGAPFDHEFRRFGRIFDEGLRRKFQDTFRNFKHHMRWADEDSRREAGDAVREAAESFRQAMDKSNLKETVESIGKTVIEAMEAAMRRFTGARKDTGDKPETGESKGGSGDTTQTV